MKTFKLYIAWCFYYFITLEKRNEFLISEIKGKKCIGSKETGIFPGLQRTYYFSASEPPEREYLTFKEFKKAYASKNK